MTTILLSDLLELTPAERIQLAQDLWDSIPEDVDVLQLTSEQQEEIERRRSAHEREPAAAVLHDDLRARLRARFGV